MNKDQIYVNFYFTFKGTGYTIHNMLKRRYSEVEVTSFKNEVILLKTKIYTMFVLVNTKIVKI